MISKEANDLIKKFRQAYPEAASIYEKEVNQMAEIKFTGWVKVPAKFSFRDCDKEEAIRRAQLGDYDIYETDPSESPIDFSINPVLSSGS